MKRLHKISTRTLLAATIVLVLAGSAVAYYVWAQNDIKLIRVGGSANQCNCSHRLDQ